MHFFHSVDKQMAMMTVQRLMGMAHVEDGVMNELELLMAARHMSSVSEVEFLKSKYSPKWHE